MRFTLTKDDGTTVVLDPMNARTAQLIAEGFSRTELPVVTAGLLLLVTHSREAIALFEEKAAQEANPYGNALANLQSMLRGGPSNGEEACGCPVCTAQKESKLNEKLSDEPATDAGRGMYL